MKFTVALVFATICLAAVVESSNIFERVFRTLHQEPPPPLGRNQTQIFTSWIEQKLDNFDPKETRTWLMRYMSNDEFFVPGGPIFIFVGGEWPISTGLITDGHMYDMAKEHNGALFYTEHRFYGESKPTSDLGIENLKYLDVKQAMADLANFIMTIHKTVEGMKNSKVILTGSSYSASMVTWFKRLYPNLIAGAWSSSAPLLAKVDFFEYYEVAGQSIRLVGGEACYKRIQNGIAELENMIFNKRSAEVKAMLKICNNFDEKKELDVWTLFYTISDYFADVVQSHNKNGKNIQNVCENIMEGEDDVEGIAKHILKYFGNDYCSDITYNSLVTSLSQSSYANGMMRPWFYQNCNEFGWYPTSGSSAQPFGSKFPVDFNIAICNDVFQLTNETVYQNADKTNEYFGGLNPNVENVYITHGQLDPWSAIGITDPKKATVIPLYAHCKDLQSISSSDSSEMRASKENIANLVRKWLK